MDNKYDSRFPGDRQRGRRGGPPAPPTYTGPNPGDRLAAHPGLQALAKQLMSYTIPARGPVALVPGLGDQENHPRVNTAVPEEQRYQEDHQMELLNGVVDMRTKIFNSDFFLIYILALLHFLTYI